MCSQCRQRLTLLTLRRSNSSVTSFEFSWSGSECPRNSVRLMWENLKTGQSSCLRRQQKGLAVAHGSVPQGLGNRGISGRSNEVVLILRNLQGLRMMESREARASFRSVSCWCYLQWSLAYCTCVPTLFGGRKVVSVVRLRKFNRLFTLDSQDFDLFMDGRAPEIYRCYC